ncbi:CPBP family intramembrane glutamic endopeptidase [Rhodanobacter soli]|uniref:CPBP family intramembrane glutamic endopeptidase n=1 Tax=Rhodanobacter soli TaxID=590609 RepID=UPI0031D69FE3
MHDQAIAFTTPPAAPRWKRWLLFSPLARIVIFVLLFMALSFASGALLRPLGWLGKDAPATLHALAQFLMRAVPALLAYLLLVRFVERRAVTELAPRKLLPDGALGTLAGLLLFSAIVGVLYLLGSYHVTGTNPDAPWVPALLMVGLGAGIGEEIICRGVLFRIVEEGLGSWWALVISALFFGAAHIANPGATLWSSAAIAIEAGLLFGMIYHLTRSLPLCMGLHAAWNFAQGTIYGIPVSGTPADGWLVSTRSGPDWLSGGVFGAEASVVALGLCSLCTLGLLVLALRRGSLVPFRPRARREQALAPR